VSTVNYVTENNQDLICQNQTFYKRVKVQVSSPYLSHAVNLDFVFTLHSK
jgi:hypothetical protein